MNDALSLITVAAGATAAAILIAAFVMMAMGQFLDSHFGRSAAPSVAVGAVLVLLVRELDPSGTGFAVVLWFGTIILAGLYGAALDAWAWLRGDYNQ